MNDWSIQQININGMLKKDAYMTQPPEFIDTINLSFVCKLKKSIYGLKQARYAWYEELSPSRIHLHSQ